MDSSPRYSAAALEKLSRQQLIAIIQEQVQPNPTAPGTPPPASVELPLKPMFEDAPVAMAFLDTQLRYQFLNRALAEMNGLPMEAHLGKTPMELLPGLDKAATEAVFAQVQQSQQPVQVESTGYLPTAPNQECHWLLSCYPIQVAGEALGIAVMIVDITERAEAEKLRNRQAQRLRSILDNLAAFVGVMTPEGMLVEANRSALQIGDLKPEDVLGKPFTDAYWWAYSPKVQRHMKKVIERAKQGEVVRFDVPIRGNDGDLLVVDFMLAPVYDEQGALHQLIPSAIDITERKLMEESLRLEQLRFRTALNTSPITVYQQDLKLRYEWVHNAPNYLPEEAMIGKTDMEILPPETAQQIVPIKEEVLQSGTGARTEFTIEVNGETLFYDLNVEPLRDTDDTIIGITCAAVDITHNKRNVIAEAEQRLLSEALADTANAINSSLNLSEVLDHILSSIGRVVPHDLADILLIDDDGEAKLVRSRGYSIYGLKNTALVLGKTVLTTPVLNRMLTTHQPVSIADTRLLDAAEQEAWREEWLRSYIGVPILWQQEVIGFLNIISRQPNFYKEQHVQRLQAFAAQAGLAIRNAQLYEKAQSAAALEERQRLARDLHDAVSQVLFTSNIIAESLERMWESNPQKVRANMDKLRQLNRGALAEMRALLLELRPHSLESTEMKLLLEQLSQAAQGRREMRIDVVAESIRDLPEDVHVTFYRIAQEALNNVVKHAEADYVKIRFTADLEGARLVVEDDGKGFDRQQANTQSFGMRIMQERLDKIGASLHVDTELGGGTVVTASWYG